MTSDELKDYRRLRWHLAYLILQITLYMVFLKLDYYTRSCACQNIALRFSLKIKNKSKSCILSTLDSGGYICSIPSSKPTCSAFSVAKEAVRRISPCISSPSPHILGPLKVLTAALSGSILMSHRYTVLRDIRLNAACANTLLSGADNYPLSQRKSK